jgi:hypothetical protein
MVSKEQERKVVEGGSIGSPTAGKNESSLGLVHYTRSNHELIDTSSGHDPDRSYLSGHRCKSNMPWDRAKS